VRGELTGSDETHGAGGDEGGDQGRGAHGKQMAEVRRLVATWHDTDALPMVQPERKAEWRRG